MPVSFSALLPNRIRRDEVRARRQGTGRVTTKRTFSLNVFKGAQLGQFGRRTGLPLKQGVKRDAYGLDDVDNFWRDSLEGAPSDQQAEGAADGEPPAPISHEAPAEAPVAEAVAEPENPFGRANKLMRTPGGARPPMVRPPSTFAHAWRPLLTRQPPSSHTQAIEEEEEVAGASPLAPTQLALSAEEEPAPAGAEAEAEVSERTEVEAPATNPFKRRGAVMRTPKRPAVRAPAPHTITTPLPLPPPPRTHSHSVPECTPTPTPARHTLPLRPQPSRPTLASDPRVHPRICAGRAAGAAESRGRRPGPGPGPGSGPG